MSGKALAVLIRDIARAEREGRCTPEYLHDAGVLLEAICRNDPMPLSFFDRVVECDESVAAAPAAKEGR